MSNQSIIADNETGTSVTVNGEPRRLRAGLTVRQTLEELGVGTERVAVEMNREIVRKGDWDRTIVPEGAALEIVEFVGGG